MFKKIILVIGALCCIASTALGAGKPTDYLVLVNKTNKLPDNYLATIRLLNVQNSLGKKFQVEATTYTQFGKLQKALLQQGIRIEMDSAYRSIARQQEIYDEFSAKYGQTYAQKYVAIPGFSEHHTGLAVDIALLEKGKLIDDNNEMLARPAAFAIIHKQMTQFGFILRYPQNRKNITGYDYEPWHLRYVGRNTAVDMHNKGLTLEEYLGTAQDYVSTWPSARETSQIIDVKTNGQRCVLSLHNKVRGQWQQEFTTDGWIGRSGLSYNRQEGDGTTPAGTFKLGRVFGIAPNPGCKLPYHLVTTYDYWLGSNDKNYNTMADIRQGNYDINNAEHLMDYPKRYQYVVDMGYNTERIVGKGSALFLHCSIGQPTSGCVAVPKPTMQHILQQLQPGALIVVR